MNVRHLGMSFWTQNPSFGRFSFSFFSTILFFGFMINTGCNSQESNPGSSGNARIDSQTEEVTIQSYPTAEPSPTPASTPEPSPSPSPSPSPTPTPTPVGCVSPSPRVVVRDDFERSGDSFNNISGWDTFVKATGTMNYTDFLTKAGVQIFDDTTEGPAAQGTRALYFFSRVMYHDSHDIFLVTQGENRLADSEKFEIKFKYLTFSLNDRLSCGPAGGEFLQVEVCNGELADCGVGGTFNPSSFEGPAWKTIIQHDPSGDNNGLDSIQHQVSDWKSVDAVFDLAGYNKTLPFVFRFHARILDKEKAFLKFIGEEESPGTCSHDPDNGIPNASAAIDDLTIFGILPCEGGGEGPPGGGEGPPGGGEEPPPGV